MFVERKDFTIGRGVIGLKEVEVEMVLFDWYVEN